MTDKSQESVMNLPARALDVMKVIREYGGFICTGSCKQLKKGQLHCRNLGGILGMGPATVWDVVNSLTEQGLLARQGEEKPVNINLTAKGKEILDQATG